MDYSLNDNPQPENQSMNSVPPAATPPPKYSYAKKKIWLWILLYLVIAAIAYGAIYYFFFYNKGGYSYAPQNYQVQSNSDTADWKTYTNDQYGFEFKYPTRLVSDYSDKEFSLPQGYLPAIPSVFGITVLNKNIQEAVNASMKQHNEIEEFNKNVTRKSIITGGKEGTRIDYNIELPNGNGPTGHSQTEVYIPLDKELTLEIAIDNDHFIYSSGGTNPDTFLSTFKFTDGFKINWQPGKDYSEHMGSKTAIFPNVSKVFDWPVIKNIPDPNIALKIENIINSDSYLLNDFSEFDATNVNGFTGASFKVNYDKNNVISLTFYISALGAYPSENSYTQNINLKTGELIKTEDVINENKVGALVGLLDAKLQKNIKDAEAESPQLKAMIECDRNSEACNYPGGFTFKKENLENFKITSTGLDFVYNFGFPHVIQALEPDGYFKMSYGELKDYINVNGVLAGEIK